MTKRRALVAATARAPLGSAVFWKSRFARYLDSFRLATTPSRGAGRRVIAAVAEAHHVDSLAALTQESRLRQGLTGGSRGVRLFLDQAFRGHRFDDVRSRSDTVYIAFELGPDINANGGAPP